MFAFPTSHTMKAGPFKKATVSIVVHVYVETNEFSVTEAVHSYILT